MLLLLLFLPTLWPCHVPGVQEATPDVQPRPWSAVRACLSGPQALGFCGLAAWRSLRGKVVPAPGCYQRPGAPLSRAPRGAERGEGAAGSGQELAASSPYAALCPAKPKPPSREGKHPPRSDFPQGGLSKRPSLPHQCPAGTTPPAFTGLLVPLRARPSTTLQSHLSVNGYRARD